MSDPAAILGALYATGEAFEHIDSTDHTARLRAAQDIVDAAQAALDLAYAARRAVAFDLQQSGMSLRQIAPLLGVSFARVKVMCDAEAALRAEQWGEYRQSAGERLQTAREAFQAAKRAQEQRCEAYALGYRAEREAFYGSDKHAQADRTEQRVNGRVQDWHEGVKR